jgi:arylsulfatase A-like enzyme
MTQGQNSGESLLRNGDPSFGHMARTGKTLKDSQPWWRPAASSRGPNIVFVLLDDLGFSDFGCYGGEIRTPHIDRLANAGLRYLQYTTVPMCTPARAALMTGKNPHAVGCGWLPHSDPGYPGYQAGEISPDAPTLPELLRQAGYGTYGVGKWHNTADHHVAAGADKSSWPLQRGFDRYYGFVGSETNLFAPGHLIDGNEFAGEHAWSPDYYSTEDWTKKAIRYLREHESLERGRRFFLYVAHNAPHLPLQARPEAIASYRGVYESGWDVVRQSRFARQKAMGLLPSQWKLGAPSPGVAAWESIPAQDRPLMAHYMQIYAAMVEAVDASVGAISEELERQGLLNDTLFIVTSDNGASSVGGPNGAANVLDKRVTKKDDPQLAAELFAAGKLGAVDSYPAYPVAWAHASNTPFRFYKRTPMNGGIRVPFIAHWPAVIRDAGAIREQWIHATDLVPTLLEWVGNEYPLQHAGYRTRHLDGFSFAATFTDAGARTARDRQYYELEGNRGFRSGPWKIVSLQPAGETIDLDRWLLFNLDDDPTECENLAARDPDRLSSLIAEFEAEAEANHVYPLDNRDFRRVLAVPAYLAQSIDQPRDFWPGTETYAANLITRLLADRDYEVLCEFEWQPGQEGILFAAGDNFFGLAAYITQDRVHVLHRASVRARREVSIALVPGAHSLKLDHRALGERRGVVSVLLNDAFAGEMETTPTFMHFIGEGLDVGVDRRRQVAEGGPKPPYPGKIRRVRISPGPQAPDSIANRHEVLSQQD